MVFFWCWRYAQNTMAFAAGRQGKATANASEWYGGAVWDERGTITVGNNAIALLDKPNHFGAPMMGTPSGRA